MANPIKDYFNRVQGGRTVMSYMRGRFPAPLRAIVEDSRSTDEDVTSYFQDLMQVALYSIPLIKGLKTGGKRASDVTAVQKDAAVHAFNEKEGAMYYAPEDIEFVDKASFIKVVHEMADLLQPLLARGAGVITESLLLACPGEDRALFEASPTHRSVKSSEWLFRQVNALIPAKGPLPWMMDGRGMMSIVSDMCLIRRTQSHQVHEFVHLDDAMYSGQQKGQLLDHLEMLSTQAQRRIHLHLMVAYASRDAAILIRNKVAALRARRPQWLTVEFTVRRLFGREPTQAQARSNTYSYRGGENNFERERTIFWHKVPDALSFPPDLGVYLRNALDIREPYKALPIDVHAHDERACAPLRTWTPHTNTNTSKLVSAHRSRSSTTGRFVTTASHHRAPLRSIKGTI